MKAIASKKELNAVQKKASELMSKGEKNITEEENKEILALGLAAQEYEKIIYQVRKPRTLEEIIEL